MSTSEYDQQVNSCICLSFLVVIWLVAGFWPDPTYIAVKENARRIDALQSQLQTLQSTVELTHKTLSQSKMIDAVHAISPNAPA